jgi:hypothetical protein|tara:strand:- start:329 stop:544 length:216 start_codon:yes stop_codon:yes gene_type:complete
MASYSQGKIIHREIDFMMGYSHPSAFNTGISGRLAKKQRMTRKYKQLWSKKDHKVFMKCIESNKSKYGYRR